MVKAGRCMCGGVRYRVTGELRDVVNCHCDPCRRWAGHHMAATNVPISDFELEAEDTLRWYDRTPTVQYGFCSRCGSSLFWRATDKANRIAVAAGSLDQPTGLRTSLEIFTAEAGDYHTLEPDIEHIPHDDPVL